MPAKTGSPYMGTPRDIIVVGASLGGIGALGELAGGLPANLPAALLVVLHTHPDSPRYLAQIIGQRSALPVAYADQDMAVERGRIYLAPPDRHLKVAPPGVCRLDKGCKVRFHRPAADVLFRSAAQSFGERVVGVVLTGGDGDGADGLRRIRAAGGVAVVQTPADALADGMPRSAIAGDHPDFVLPLAEMAALLTRLVHGEAPTDAPSAHPAL